MTLVNGTGGVLATALSVPMLPGAPITRKRGNDKTFLLCLTPKHLSHSRVSNSSAIFNGIPDTVSVIIATFLTLPSLLLARICYKAIQRNPMHYKKKKYLVN